MLRLIFLFGCLVLATPGLGAQEVHKASVKQHLKTAGKDVGHGARKVGRGFKHGAQDVGHGSKRGAKDVGHGVKHAVKQD